MKVEIIYSDPNLIVVNKPAGMVVHGTKGSGDARLTLAEHLAEKFPEIKKVGDEPELRPGIVHRLDKDTSGVMIVARNQATFSALKNLFKERAIEKTYQAIVCGRLRTKSGIISFPIGRMIKNPLKRGIEKGRSKIRGSREAFTEFKLLQAGEKYSWVELRPKTGRMHQLRVHLKAIGHPVACDRVYGGEKVCCPDGTLRQLLHAKSISFSFPEGRRLYFEADLPEDFLDAARIVA